MRELLKIIERKSFTEPIPDWYAAMGFCDFHRVTGYLADAICACPSAPPQVKRHARIQKTYQAYKQRLLIDAARELSARLDEVGMPHAVLKGVALTHELYALGERCSNDVDLLITPDNIGKCSASIRELGYVQGTYRDGKIAEFSRSEIISRRMNRGETAPFVRLTGDEVAPFVEVDLNFTLGWLPTDGRGLAEKFLHSVVVKHTGLPTLDPEHTLLFLCAHLYKEAVVYSMVMRGKDIELYKYLDILLYQKRVDLGRFWRLADEYGLTEQCEFALWNTRELFGSCKIDFDSPPNMNFVIDPENGDKRYVWKLLFIERVFDTDRIRALREVRCDAD